MKQTLITVLLLISFFAQGQTTIEYLDINNVKAAFLNRGDMFWKPDSGVAGYEFPKGSGKTATMQALYGFQGSTRRQITCT